ncbi:MAG: pitrilysin family protein [Bacteroidia bacterium]
MQSSPKTIELSNSTTNGALIPFRKYQLANGLIVILHKDNSDPVVHVDVTYHVGSAREEIGKSGFAHFFEHMMFQGSKHVGDQEHFKVITESGGTLNGTTNRDRTNYYETVPSNQLETVLWLESDRMGFMIEGITQKKFEIQRDTVKNEKQQNYENRPYGMVHELECKNLYPSGHPYSWTTIGDMEDLDSVGVEDLKAFFLRYYGPNNAYLTISGDFDYDNALQLVERYFGGIPAGPELARIQPRPFRLTADRFISYPDKIHFPLLQFVYPTVPAFHEDEAPLDMLSDILGSSKESIFYQTLVKSQKAAQAYVFQPAYQLAGEFQLNAFAYPNVGLKEIEDIFYSNLEHVAKNGISEKDLERAKAGHEAQFIYGLESVKGKATRLASYQYLIGEPGFTEKDIDRYNGVSSEDVMRVFKKYIYAKPKLVITAYPEDKPETVTHPDNYTTPAKPSPQKEGLKTKKRITHETFDRSAKPQAPKAKLPIVPEFKQDVLANGLKIVASRNKEVPAVALRLYIDCGHWRDPKGQEGLAYVLAGMLSESTLNFSSEEISSQIERLGSQIQIKADREYMHAEVKSLTKNFMPTMELLREVLFRPAFLEEDFQRVKMQQLEHITNQAKQPATLVSKAFSGIIYGNDHVYSTPTLGTYESVSSITLEDVKNFYKNNFLPDNAKLVSCGDVGEDEVLAALGEIGTWESGVYPSEEFFAIKKLPETRVYLVNKDDAPQSEIRVGYLALPFDATGPYFKSQIMNYPLGGAFNSRINLNLREDKGYTYGAGSFFYGSKFPGPFTVYTSVRADATAHAVEEIMRELEDFRKKGMSAEELQFTKNSLGQRDALKYETNYQKLNFLMKIAEYNLDKDFVKEQSAILNGITKHELDDIATQHLPADQMAIVIVGNSNRILPGLEKLGYGKVVELDVNGAVAS